MYIISVFNNQKKKNSYTSFKVLNNQSDIRFGKSHLTNYIVTIDLKKNYDWLWNQIFTTFTEMHVLYMYCLHLSHCICKILYESYFYCGHSPNLVVYYPWQKKIILNLVSTKPPAQATSNSSHFDYLTILLSPALMQCLVLIKLKDYII